MSSLPSLVIENLGNATIKSPIQLSEERSYIDDKERLLSDPYIAVFETYKASGKSPETFELAGPRQTIFFNPARTKVGIVTCGGLCPGINAVIRALVMQLWHRYGCKNILGIRYGYHGLGASAPQEFLQLTPEMVLFAHERGGTMLGSSRGAPPPEEIVDTLERNNINILFTIGGDGTMRGANAIWQEVKKRGQKIAVVGIPKTIDNDIPFVRRSFGFETAVGIASEAVRSAAVEASGTINGIGLVKLMGRHSGYIAANATLAAGHANFCLIPEVKFKLEGEGGLLALVEKRLQERGHAVIVAAEGAGQDFFKDKPLEKDASGNVKLVDIGVYLKERFSAHLKAKGVTYSMKYIDPSYMIRAAAANPADQLFCARLAQNAVHAAMVGKTGMLIGYWHGQMTHVPMEALGHDRQSISAKGELWFNVLESTGQPPKIA